MEEQIPQAEKPSDEALAVLAEVAQAVGDAARRRRFLDDPASEVKDFHILPAALRETLIDMSEDELSVVGRLCPDLAENGFFIQTARGPLCMF